MEADPRVGGHRGVDGPGRVDRGGASGAVRSLILAAGVVTFAVGWPLGLTYIYWLFIAAHHR